VSEHVNDNSPGVQERALLYSASTGASSRAHRLELVGRVRARDRREVPWQTRRRRSSAAAKTSKRARRRRPSAQARRRLSRPRLSGTSRPRIHGNPNAAPVETARWEATPPATADRRSDTLASASTSRAATSSGRDQVVMGGNAAAGRPDRLRAPLRPDRPGRDGRVHRLFTHRSFGTRPAVPFILAAPGSAAIEGQVMSGGGERCAASCPRTWAGCSGTTSAARERAMQRTCSPTR
jgi:hypothetical protein